MKIWERKDGECEGERKEGGRYEIEEDGNGDKEERKGRERERK